MFSSLKNVKNTEDQQLGPQLALGWVTIQGIAVDAVYCTVATTYRIITETEKRGKKIYKYTVYKITVQELSMTEIF